VAVKPALGDRDTGVMEMGVAEVGRLRDELRLSGVRGGEKEGGDGAHCADQGVRMPEL